MPKKKTDNGIDKDFISYTKSFFPSKVSFGWIRSSPSQCGLKLTLSPVSTSLILAVCRTHLIHEPCIRPSSPWVLWSSVLRASDQCTEGHRFNSCWKLSFFSLSHAHDILITSFLIFSLSLKFTIILYLPFKLNVYILKATVSCLHIFSHSVIFKFIL